MNEPRVAIHLREGIHPAVQTDLDGVGVRAYPAAAPFAQLAAQVREANADVHVFCDLLPSQVMLRGLLRMLARAQMRAAATPVSSALARLGYATPVAGAGGGVGTQVLPCDVLPAWCSALPNAVLEATSFFDGDEATLDFRLLRVSQGMSATGAPRFAVGAPLDALDERAWARTLLLTLQDGLARDFADSANPSRVPHQLRVTQRGDFGDAVPEPTTAGPLFSLLCPAYKPEFVEETIRSVVAQAYPNWELLILVDGPPPVSRAAYESILASFTHEPRVKPAFQENIGTAITRQRLLERATGDYVMFIDDDDLLLDDCLGIFAACLAEDPSLDVIRAGAKLFGVVNRYLPPLKRLAVDGVSASLFEVTQPFAVRRSLIESFGGLHGDPGFGDVGEDSDLFLRLDGCAARTRLIDRPLYGRRLSTLNQSLNFHGGDFTEHVRTLARRHCAAAWSLDALTFKLEHGFVTQSAIYNAMSGTRVLHCPTRYFNYNTLGEEG